MGANESSLNDVDDHPLTTIKKSTEIKFRLQGAEHVAQCEKITPNTSLNHYLRNILNMTGTKAMCYEGGCGSCTVVLKQQDPITQKDVFLAVNSCLVPLLSCNGWNIFTIEGIGNPVEGYHPIQEVLAQFNGTQCGFCSPGMVMNMYALYESGKLTMQDVENSFSGNICRCTGYRSILSAFKSLCKDATPEVLGECPDIEDFVFCYKERCAKKCSRDCIKTIQEPFYMELSDTKWVKVHTLRDLLRTMKMDSSYRLVAGNTAHGVYSSYKKSVNLYIDISDVMELKEHNIKNNTCILGANITLTDVIEWFQIISKNTSGFAYLKTIAHHIDLVANVPVRNRGTIAGNLIIKHDHHDFASDIFLILETVGAKLTIVNISGKETKLSPLEFINYDMKKERVVLKSVTLVSYPDTVKCITYKIMPRAQNTLATINAGFLFKFDKNGLIASATIVYGNINPKFVHATESEHLLIGKDLFKNSVLKQVYKSLDKELEPDIIPPSASPKLRKKLAISLFYKAVLSIAPAEKLSPLNKSGGELLKRPISKGAQDYETNKSLYPLTEAIPKLDALAQTSGVAKYVVDLPDLPFQLFGNLVLAKAPPHSTIRRIDASRALKTDGIVAFYTKDDIPGDNIFTPLSAFTTSEEELFSNGTVKFYEQPIGILVGKDQKVVDEAEKLIEVTYDAPNVEPLISIRQILKQGATDRINTYKVIKPTRKGTDIKHVVKGTFDISHQYHFHMETQCCYVVPNEHGLDVFASTQWMDLMQMAIARVLKVDQSKIHVIAYRCGGSFGAKLSRANMVACSAALAAWKLKQPVRIWMPLHANMVAIGKRFPLSTDYEVGVNDKGVIQYLNCSHYTDVGYQFNEDITDYFERIFMNIYSSETFTVNISRVETDTHTNTWARAPGSLEGLGAVEAIMEHISYATGLNPVDVRLANLSDKTPIAKYIADMKSWADTDKRKAEIEAFNKENRWKKKGLAIVPMSFDMLVIGPHFATISIFHGDGSVQISHGGVEVGQGIHTKAAQVCAYKFGIPLEKVIVLRSNTFVSANNSLTGGSMTTDGVCYAVVQACDELLARIKPYQEKDSKWEDVIRKSHDNFINLKATGVYSPNFKDVKDYSVYGVCTTEVEVDILTGQHMVTKVHLLEDTGVTLNPILDVGQAEGAFVMGQGYYTMENYVYNYEGRVLTNNTWTYLVPGAKDIPIDFNVKFPKNNPNPVGVLKSKGTGEPAISFGIVVALAIRNALASARTDAAPSNKKWYKIDGATTLENVFLNCKNDSSQYVL